MNKKLSIILIVIVNCVNQFSEPDVTNAINHLLHQNPPWWLIHLMLALITTLHDLIILIIMNNN